MAIPEKRFWLFDTTDEFDPLEFGPWKQDSVTILGKANPTNYNWEREDPIRSKIAINGYRQSAMAPKAPESRRLEWERIEEPFYNSLKLRADSGNVFILQDHNKQILVGRIKDFSFKEITATVPSAYEGSFIFESVGNWTQVITGTVE